MILDAARMPVLVLSLALAACSSTNDGGFGGAGGAGGSTTVASAGGEQPSTTGEPTCSVGTSGSHGTVCIDPADVVVPTTGSGGSGGQAGSGGSGGQDGLGGAGGSGGQGGLGGLGGAGGSTGQGGGEPVACPSGEDARAAIEAEDPYVTIVADEGTLNENGLCCYSVIHSLCH